MYARLISIRGKEAQYLSEKDKLAGDLNTFVSRNTADLSESWRRQTSFWQELPTPRGQGQVTASEELPAPQGLPRESRALRRVPAHNRPSAREVHRRQVMLHDPRRRLWYRSWAACSQVPAPALPRARSPDSPRPSRPVVSSPQGQRSRGPSRAGSNQEARGGGARRSQEGGRSDCEAGCRRTQTWNLLLLLAETKGLEYGSCLNKRAILSGLGRTSSLVPPSVVVSGVCICTRISE
ncbi:hypothetical protein C8Q80DRAFT_938020 [Daedaleopsis nitida]|nr:hypothetical protein C8Q80DRAFT_938020 [Daedaleopsis nitida]